MPRHSPHVNFLVRASAALILLSAVWWFILLDPLVSGLREITKFVGNLVFERASCELVRETAAGNWDVCVPIDGVHASRKSIEFELARSGPIAFTFGLPVCLAMLLAAPQSRRAWRTLVTGTSVTALLETLLLSLFLVTYAHAVEAQPDLARNAAKKWFFDVAQYLELNVGPALAPFLVAVWLNRDLLWHALGRGEMIERERDKRGTSSKRRRRIAVAKPDTV
ncbi:MAG TPA: exosortase H-associated membrane protein [Bryobacteraceae bacterium]|nr:exosortase H-associated membrane protein [Bryobacteraceae bacterium]